MIYMHACIHIIIISTYYAALHTQCVIHSIHTPQHPHTTTSTYHNASCTTDSGLHEAAAEAAWRMGQWGALDVHRGGFDVHTSGAGGEGTVHGMVCLNKWM